MSSVFWIYSDKYEGRRSFTARKENISAAGRTTIARRPIFIAIRRNRNTAEK
jgi:hypothetical protein